MSTQKTKKIQLDTFKKNVIILADAAVIYLFILMINTTLVTGIWDLDRESLSEGWSRNFDHYITHFENLLKNTLDIPLVVFIDPKHEYIVWKHRDQKNTKVYHHKKEDFSGRFFPFFDKVQSIRTNPDWYNQVGWLKDSTQAKMEYYNPMVMSKMFLLHNAKIFNPFNTEYMFWIDGGITNTVHPGYFSKDKVIEKLQESVEKLLFICFPYDTTTEIHGFDIKKMNEFSANQKVTRVARGGFFGGHIEYISKANDLYYSLLSDSLSNGLMGTEESIFTIMTYIDPDIYKHEMINGDGLINTFFENVKKYDIKNDNKKINQRKPFNNKDTILYINTFNSPEQLQMVLDSFETNDNNFITNTVKILINNSTDTNTYDQYDSICSKYNFKDQIKQGNLGVCGGRQFSAKHFADSGSRYMIFFEDDMLLDFSHNTCSFGFNKNVPNLFNQIIRIMSIEKYDFLKFSFSEFYGHNGDQWSWHNIPSDKKIKYFGNINKKPFTNFRHIKSYNGLPYAEGEVYYSNWPHIIDQEGNQKLFLDTTWDRPFEQTWMSNTYTLTVEEKVRSAILLASPITHNRIHFYEARERKES